MIKVSYLEGNQLIEEEYRYIVDFLDDHIPEEYVHEIIDEQNDIIDIYGMKYYPSNVLKETDPVAYRQIWLDIIDSIAADIEYDLKRYEEPAEFNGYQIEQIEEEV